MDSMPGMNGSTPSPATMPKMHFTHMTFFWGKDSEILFTGWPGQRGGMYAVALIFIFVLTVILEALSNCRWIKKDKKGGGSTSFRVALLHTVVHGVRIAIAYLLMLALMSFNVGVFIVAVAGHTIGFLVFRSRQVNESTPSTACVP